jgi:hypothetical protein
LLLLQRWQAEARPRTVAQAETTTVAGLLVAGEAEERGAQRQARCPGRAQPRLGRLLVSPSKCLTQIALTFRPRAELAIALAT